jgi:hypothetical protein
MALFECLHILPNADWEKASELTFNGGIEPEKSEIIKIYC